MNIYYPYNDELYHHGVKGMRWGVLRSRTAVLYDKNPGHKAKSENSSSKNSYEGEAYKGKKSIVKSYKDRRDYWQEQGRIAAAERDAARARKLSKKNGSDATQAKIKRSKKNRSVAKIVTAPLSAMGSGVATVGSAGMTGAKRVKRNVKRATKRR